MVFKYTENPGMNETDKKKDNSPVLFSEKIKEHLPPSGMDDISRVFVEQQSKIINEVNDSIQTDEPSKK